MLDVVARDGVVDDAKHQLVGLRRIACAQNAHVAVLDEDPIVSGTRRALSWMG
jgi:hypothetical protein